MADMNSSYFERKRFLKNSIKETYDRQNELDELLVRYHAQNKKEHNSLHARHYFEMFKTGRKIEMERLLSQAMLVHTVWNEHDHTIWGIVKFNEDWNGFMITSNFKKSFKTVNLGKRDWKEWQSNPGLSTYGWGARADDYTAEDANY